MCYTVLAGTIFYPPKEAGGKKLSIYMLTGVTSTGRSSADVTNDKEKGGGSYMLVGFTSTGPSSADVTKPKSDAGKKSVKSGKDKTHATTCGKRFSSGSTTNPKHQPMSKPPCTQSASTEISVCCNSRVCKCDGEGNLH